jgi:hypothetical protein
VGKGDGEGWRSPISPSCATEHTRSRTPSAIFQTVSRRGFLRSSYAGSRINWSPEIAIPVRSFDRATRSTQHLGGVYKVALLRIEGRGQTNADLATYTLSASRTPSLHQDRLHTLSHSSNGEIPTVRQCQKCQKGNRRAFGTLLGWGCRDFSCRRRGSIWTDLFCFAWGCCAQISQAFSQGVISLEVHLSPAVSPMLSVWPRVSRKP